MIRDAWIWCLTPLLYVITIIWVLFIMLMFGPKACNEVTDRLMKSLKELIK